MRWGYPPIWSDDPHEMVHIPHSFAGDDSSFKDIG